MDGSISIILPVYNQADHIATRIKEYASVLERLPRPFEIIPVVNGPCRDNSLAICQDLASRERSVKVIRTEQGGWGHAVRVGLAAAEGELLCYTNSARTTGRDLSLTLLVAMTYPEMVVKATRRLRDTLVRQLGSLLYNLEGRALFDLPYWDVNGTPKVFSRNFDRLLKLTRNDDLIDLEFCVICHQQDYQLIDVPLVSNNQRFGGNSTTSFRSAVKLYLGAYRLWRDRDHQRA